MFTSIAKMYEVRVVNIHRLGDLRISHNQNRIFVAHRKRLIFQLIGKRYMFYTSNC
jgi:molybdopterin synthase catalytic subunit